MKCIFASQHCNMIPIPVSSNDGSSVDPADSYSQSDAAEPGVRLEAVDGRRWSGIRPSRGCSLTFTTNIRMEWRDYLAAAARVLANHGAAAKVR